MNNQTIIEIRRGLEDAGYSLAALGREIGCAKQSVSRSLRRPDEYPRIRDAIIAKLGRNPWTEENAA